VVFVIVCLSLWLKHAPSLLADLGWDFDPGFPVICVSALLL
jgi:hypothetical protein